MVDESVSARQVLSLVRTAQRALQQAAEQRSASQQEPEPAPSEQRAQPPERSKPEQPEPGSQGQQVARLAQPELQLAWRLARQLVSQVSRPHWASQPRVLEEPQDASVQPWRQLPSQRFPP